jgi:homoaconitase/3-isopropylmalate dehydratase large subunit
MGHTATEKILAKHAGLKEVFPGDVVTCDVDLIFAHSPWYIERYWNQMVERTMFSTGIRWRSAWGITCACHLTR